MEKLKLGTSGISDLLDFKTGELEVLESAKDVTRDMIKRVEKLSVSRREQLISNCEKRMSESRASERRNPDRSCKLKGPMRGVEEDNAFRNVEWEATLPNGVVTDLINKRKPGYDKCSVFESSIPNAGLGLFATRNIPAKEKICSYEGPQVSQERVDEGYGKTNDYLAEVVTDRSTGEMIIIDGEGMSHFGRFANDPLDDLAVNAKIVWVGNKAVLVATTDIVAGDEILISYGTGYWKEREERIVYISEDKRERIRSGKTVIFDAVKTLIPYPWTSGGLPLASVTPLFKELEKERGKISLNHY